MRTFSANVLSLIALANTETFYLVRILSKVGDITNAGSFVVGNHYTIKTVGTTDFTAIGAANNNIGTLFLASGVGTGSGTAYSSVYDSTLSFAATITGLGKFTPSGELAKVEPPRLSDVVDREAYKITYIDPLFTKLLPFENGLVGTKASVYVGLINTTNSNMTSGGNTVLPGAPLLGIDDIITVYEGTVDTHGYAIDPKSGTSIVTIECASPMSALGMSKSFMTSQDAMKQVNANDSAFDQIYVGSKKINQVWGKA